MRKDFNIEPYLPCKYQIGTEHEHLMPTPMGYTRQGAIKQYEAKNYCDSNCANLDQWKPADDRFCACGTLIPREDASGVRMKSSRYLARTTCGDPECVVKAKMNGRKPKKKKGPRVMRIRKWHTAPDLIEQWCLGSTPPPVHIPGVFDINELREMMNDLINPRLAA